MKMDETNVADVDHQLHIGSLDHPEKFQNKVSKTIKKLCKVLEMLDGIRWSGCGRMKPSDALDEVG